MTRGLVRHRVGAVVSRVGRVVAALALTTFLVLAAPVMMPGPPPSSAQAEAATQDISVPVGALGALLLAIVLAVPLILRSRTSTGHRADPR